MRPVPIPVLILLSGALTSCASDNTPQLSVAVRHAIQLAQSGEGRLAEAYCLAGADSPDSLPTPSLLAAFRDHAPPVYSANQCLLDPSVGGYRIRGSTVQAALVWARMVNDDSEEKRVELGFNAGPLAAAAYTCALRHIPSAWEIRDCTIDWIS